jgi:hypothetical protein
MNLSMSMYFVVFTHVFGGNHATAVKFENVIGGPSLRSGWQFNPKFENTRFSTTNLDSRMMGIEPGFLFWLATSAP